MSGKSRKFRYKAYSSFRLNISHHTLIWAVQDYGKGVSVNGTIRNPNKSNLSRCKAEHKVVEGQLGEQCKIATNLSLFIISSLEFA